MDAADRREIDQICLRLSEYISKLDALAHDVDGILTEDRIKAEVDRRVRLARTRKWSVEQRLVIAATAFSSIGTFVYSFFK